MELSESKVIVMATCSIKSIVSEYLGHKWIKDQVIESKDNSKRSKPKYKELITSIDGNYRILEQEVT